MKSLKEMNSEFENLSIMISNEINGINRKIDELNYRYKVLNKLECQIELISIQQKESELKNNKYFLQDLLSKINNYINNEKD